MLVVDNHDSFVHTLVDYLAQLGATVTMVEADEIAPGREAMDAALTPFDGVLISPGPGSPAQAGASIDVVRAAALRRMPVLGVCLGHQVIAEAFGARVSHAPELMHGMTSSIHHDGSALYRGLRDGFTANRYHSLAVERESMPADLVVTSVAAGSRVVMGLSHRDLPIDGVQFHPESVLTQGGHRLLENWLATL